MVTATKLVEVPVQDSRMYERHYSPAEIAELWNLSADCVRNIFEHEPGVLVIGNPIPRRGKRSYTTLRIPQSVLGRVHKRMSKV
jgi:hypothetical protein